MQNKKYFVVEHMEPSFYKWSRIEYLQIQKYLENSNIDLIFSNLSESQKEEKSKFLESLNPKTIISTKPIKDLLEGQEIFPKEVKVCLLDMRGEKDLCPEDLDLFDCFLFGGILGDHPPRDRTYPLRQLNVQFRRLGDLQLATDTAALVCRLILNEKIMFSNIPFIDEPEFQMDNIEGVEESVLMEGFRYVSSKLDMKTFKIAENQTNEEPIINPEIKQLLCEDFNVNEIM